jgi:long-chain acyl-CoA synthetase
MVAILEAAEPASATAPAWPSLPAMFFTQAARRAGRPFLWSKACGQYRPLSWTNVADAVERLARGLIVIGVGRGDRVALFAENRPEWVIADLAIMSVGAVTVPGYVTNTLESNRHVIEHSGSKVVIVSSASLAQRVIPAANLAAAVESVIAIEPPGLETRARLRLWDDMLALGAGIDAAVDVTALTPDDMACMPYTSGTGGVPKGVMTTHRNILANCRGAYRMLEMLGIGDEVFLNFLPLSHAYEHTGGLMFPISIGAEVYFAERPETLPSNMIEARPTIMTAVPRLYETLHQRIRLGVERQSRFHRYLFETAVALGRKRLAGEPLAVGERLLDRAADKLVRSKVQARFGGRLKAMVSGGAPLNPEIGSFFLALGVRLLQGYGQTETAPVVTCNHPSRIKADTVGIPIDGVRVRIAEDGEILVAGDNVMKGYWQDPEATIRTIENGWLRTGDIGRFDEDGHLKITDRKRDFIKNSGGEMIAPSRVESALTLQPEIAQAIVVGDQRPYLTALIVPEPDCLAAVTGRRHVDLAELAESQDIAQSLAAAVGRANRTLAPIEHIRRFLITPEPFTVANGQLTPTLKLRRHAIVEAYGAALQTVYEGKGIAAGTATA